MVSSVLVDALSDPTRSLVELYNEIKDIDNFPARVAAHFADIFASKDAYSEIPSLHTVDPTQNDRCLVSFRAMIQDTSPSPEMYLAKRSGGRCGGWGLTDDQSTDDLEYSDLRENTVVWAVSVPSESPWVAAELDTGLNASSLTRPTILESRPHKPHKFPDPGTPHLGVQVKVYDRVDSLRATDVATLVGILTMECMTADLESPNVAPVPTVHLLFSRHLPLTISPRVFPYSPATTTFQTLREELISWIADEGLAGDRDAAEWVLLSIIAKVQSRTPALLPPSLTISQFPPPAAQSSTPSLSTVLSHLLPTVVTLPLSLDVLNSSSFYPESKNEDLHSGRLQLPRGSVCVVTEGGVTEGGVFDRGIMNLRAMQEMMSTQTLEYAFPFSRFTFQTDVVFLILSQGKKSTFFQTNLNLPLRPNNKGELYSSPSKTKLPAPETLMMFRNLVGGAKTGNVSVGEKVAEYIQEDFVSERKAASSAATVTSDDLIHRMMIARLLTLSLHQSEVSTEIWERVKAMEETRKMRLDAIGSAK